MSYLSHAADHRNESMMGDEPPAVEEEEEPDEDEVQLLYEALRLGFSPKAIEDCKSAAPPANMLIVVGDEHGPKRVNQKHIKQYKELLKAVAAKFPNRLPSKPTCKMAMQKLDEAHACKLSHARKKKGGTYHKGDGRTWMKDQGEALNYLLGAFWKLRVKTDKAHDPVIRELKLLFTPVPGCGASRARAQEKKATEAVGKKAPEFARLLRSRRTRRQMQARRASQPRLCSAATWEAYPETP